MVHDSQIRSCGHHNHFVCGYESFLAKCEQWMQKIFLMKNSILMEKSYAPFSINYFTVFSFILKLPYNMKLLAFCNIQQPGLFYSVLLNSSSQISHTFLGESCSKSCHSVRPDTSERLFIHGRQGTAGVHFSQCWLQGLMWFSFIVISFHGFRWTQSLPHDLLVHESLVTQSRRCSHCAKRRHHHVAKHTESNRGSVEGEVGYGGE